MLDEIIINELNKYDDTKNFNNEIINHYNDELGKILLSIKDKIGYELYFDLDSLIGEACVTYQVEFFKEGFKKGLKLSNEIKQI